MEHFNEHTYSQQNLTSHITLRQAKNREETIARRRFADSGSIPHEHLAYRFNAAGTEGSSSSIACTIYGKFTLFIVKPYHSCANIPSHVGRLPVIIAIGSKRRLIRLNET